VRGGAVTSTSARLRYSSVYIRLSVSDAARIKVSRLRMRVCVRVGRPVSMPEHSREATGSCRRVTRRLITRRGDY